MEDNGLYITNETSLTLLLTPNQGEPRQLAPLATQRFPFETVSSVEIEDSASQFPIRVVHDRHWPRVVISVDDLRSPRNEYGPLGKSRVLLRNQAPCLVDVFYRDAAGEEQRLGERLARVGVVLVAQEPRRRRPRLQVARAVDHHAEARRDVPKLLSTPAAVRFVSIEPMLGAVDLRHDGVGVDHEHRGRPLRAIERGATVDRAWRFRSWDRFVLPKPFARVTVTTAPVTMVEATSPEAAEGEQERFRAILMGVCTPDEG